MLQDLGKAVPSLQSSSFALEDTFSPLSPSTSPQLSQREPVYLSSPKVHKKSNFNVSGRVGEAKTHALQVERVQNLFRHEPSNALPLWKLCSARVYLLHIGKKQIFPLTTPGTSLCGGNTSTASFGVVVPEGEEKGAPRLPQPVPAGAGLTHKSYRDDDRLLPVAYSLFYKPPSQDLTLLRHHSNGCEPAPHPPLVCLASPGLELGTSGFSPKLGPHELLLLGCDVAEFYSKLSNDGCQEWRTVKSLQRLKLSIKKELQLWGNVT